MVNPFIHIPPATNFYIKKSPASLPETGYPAVLLCLTSRKSSLLQAIQPGHPLSGMRRAGLPGIAAFGRPARGPVGQDFRDCLAPTGSSLDPAPLAVLPSQHWICRDPITRKKGRQSALCPYCSKSAQYGHAMNKKTSKNQFRNIIAAAPASRPPLHPSGQQIVPQQRIQQEGQPGAGRSCEAAAGGYPAGSRTARSAAGAGWPR